MLERKMKDDQGRTCRICLEEDETSENPFIIPCECSGSVKFIHLKCLRDWLNSKRVKQVSSNLSPGNKEGNVTFYYWKDLQCEMCKNLFKD